MLQALGNEKIFYRISLAELLGLTQNVRVVQQAYKSRYGRPD